MKTVLFIIISLLFIILISFFAVKSAEKENKIYYQYVGNCIEKGKRVDDCKYLFKAQKYKD